MLKEFKLKMTGILKEGQGQSDLILNKDQRSSSSLMSGGPHRPQNLF